MWLNLGWLGLGLLTCQVSRASDTDSDVGVLLFCATNMLALLSLSGRGRWLAAAYLPLGVVGICYFNNCGRLELAWIPLFLGLLVAIHNLGNGRPLTPPVAVGQLLFLGAPAIALAALGLLWAVPAALAGLALTSLAALPYSRWAR